MTTPAVPAAASPWLALVAKHGAWALLAAFLLWRDDARRSDETRERREVLTSIRDAVRELASAEDRHALACAPSTAVRGRP